MWQAEAADLIAAIVQRESDARAAAAAAKKASAAAAAAAAAAAPAAAVAAAAAGAAKASTPTPGGAKSVAVTKTTCEAEPIKKKAPRGKVELAAPVPSTRGRVRHEGLRGTPSMCHELSRKQYLFRSGFKGVNSGNVAIKYGPGTKVKDADAAHKLAAAMVEKAKVGLGLSA